MNYQYIIYIWMLFFSGVITALLGGIVYIWRKESKEAIFFTFSMIVLTLWSITNAFEMISTSLSTKLFWANMQYFAYCFSPVTLLGLCMEFTEINQWIRNKKFLWLTVLPTIILILVWTNSYHGLIRYGVYLKDSELFPVISKQYGIAFYIHAIYSHSLNMIAAVLLSRSLILKRYKNRQQTMALLLGAAMIMTPSIIYVIGLSPFDMDITPILFGPAGIMIVWAIYRYKLFELIPLARAKVIESMNIGIMVLDLEDKIQDINPAMVKLASPSSSNYLDVSVEELFIRTPGIIQAIKKGEKSSTEFAVEQNGTYRIYEVLITPLMNKKDKMIARLVMFYEITEKKRAQEEYMKQQWTLAGLKEKERLARDLHDNLGQLLAFINLQAQGINQELKNHGVDIVTDKLSQLTQIAQTAHTELRGYICDVRMRIESEQDFIDTFYKQLQIFKEQTGIHLDMDYACDLAGKDLKPFIWLNMFHILKEALSNIQKHAMAGKVMITLKQEERQLYVSVKDDGFGIKNSLKHKDMKKDKQTGFGLEIMRERAELIGGELTIRSELGKGTEILLQVPLTERRFDDGDETYASR